MRSISSSSIMTTDLNVFLPLCFTQLTGKIVSVGRDGVEDAKTRLGLIPLHKRSDQRSGLLMHILAKEQHHSSLSELYNVMMNQPTMSMTTRLQTHGIPATFRTNNTQYHNSFLPQTIRDLKGQGEWTNCILQCQHWANTYCQHHIDRAYITCTDEYRPERLNKLKYLGVIIQSVTLEI